jgi:hypothetical protein
MLLSISALDQQFIYLRYFKIMRSRAFNFQEKKSTNKIEHVLKCSLHGWRKKVHILISDRATAY